MHVLLLHSVYIGDGVKDIRPVISYVNSLVGNLAIYNTVCVI